ncbi:MAG: LPS-assembly protein LptD [Pseudolabrys sp.]|nr:LPS-assembly protein LptD [Pseudolabrys sp.]
MALLNSTRPPAPGRFRRGALSILTVLVLAAASCVGSWSPAHAQTTIEFPAPPPARAKSRAAIERDKSGDKQMLVQAAEIDYDYANNRVSAVGNVQIYYGGSTLEAHRVIYDQKTKRLHAEGNVRLTEEDGKVTNGEVMDLSDDYRDGFVDSLRLETPDRTRMAAARADRTKGNYTVFHNGVYTACEPCKDNPKKPPLWQVKAARIIHDQGEKMIYFEDAKIEFFGMPMMYLPYFSAPDPTVKRKTGFLMPSVSTSSKYGTAVEIPYYWALAPNYDLTLAPMMTTKQGLLMEGEFRHRLINGAYSIRAAGIHQNDPSYFQRSGNPTPGYRDNRGSLETSGRFAINEKWAWGWDALMVSDRSFIQDYNPRLSHYRINDPLQSGVTEGVSQLYLTGKGNRSYFDARSIYYLGLSESDTQAQIPVVHPVIDYMYTVDHPVVGGELGFNFNFTSLSRTQANFDAITKTALTAGTGGGNLCNTADPAAKTSANCLLRGAPGNFNRFTSEAHWSRSITDGLGQVFKPFASVRVDAGSMNVNNDPSVSNYLTPGNTDLVRAMPTVGLEYRFPFINVSSWGTQTIEPIAQVILRPNESQIGKWVNEDAQSLIFDDSNLFKVDKFSGYDRVEGGSRANYGLQYTAQFNKGGFINALFGQSYSLFGQNSFAVSGVTNTGLDSGLDTRRSDYVARLSYQPNSTYTFSSRFRFDQDSFAMQRLEVESTANFDRWSASVLYGDYAAQPLIGFLDRRQGILGTGQYKIDANWVVLGSALYDINEKKFSQTRLGLGYIDDCLILAVNYITNYTYSGNVENNHTVMLQLSLRTLGGTSVSQSLSANNNNQ